MCKDYLEEIEKAEQQDWVAALKGRTASSLNLRHAVLLAAAGDGAIGH